MFGRLFSAVLIVAFVFSVLSNPARAMQPEAGIMRCPKTQFGAITINRCFGVVVGGVALVGASSMQAAGVTTTPGGMVVVAFLAIGANVVAYIVQNPPEGLYYESYDTIEDATNAFVQSLPQQITSAWPGYSALPEISNQFTSATVNVPEGAGSVLVPGGTVEDFQHAMESRGIAIGQCASSRHKTDYGKKAFSAGYFATMMCWDEFRTNVSGLYYSPTNNRLVALGRIPATGWEAAAIFQAVPGVGGLPMGYGKLITFIFRPTASWEQFLTSSCASVKLLLDQGYYPQYEPSPIGMGTCKANR